MVLIGSLSFKSKTPPKLERKKMQISNDRDALTKVGAGDPLWNQFESIDGHFQDNGLVLMPEAHDFDIDNFDESVLAYLEGKWKQTILNLGERVIFSPIIGEKITISIEFKNVRSTSESFESVLVTLIGRMSDDDSYFIAENVNVNSKPFKHTPGYYTTCTITTPLYQILTT